MRSMVGTIERRGDQVFCSACGEEFQPGVLDTGFTVDPENIDGLYRAKDGTLLHACWVEEEEDDWALRRTL